MAEPIDDRERVRILLAAAKSALAFLEDEIPQDATAPETSQIAAAARLKAELAAAIKLARP